MRSIGSWAMPFFGSRSAPPITLRFLMRLACVLRKVVKLPSSLPPAPAGMLVGIRCSTNRRA